MSKTQKQQIIDVTNIMFMLDTNELRAITVYAEKIIDLKLLSLVPDAILKNMDITEKLMMIREFSKTEEQRKREREEAIPFEEALKEAGLTKDIKQNTD